MHHSFLTENYRARRPFPASVGKRTFRNQGSTKEREAVRLDKDEREEPEYTVKCLRSSTLIAFAFAASNSACTCCASIIQGAFPPVSAGCAFEVQWVHGLLQLLHFHFDLFRKLSSS
eukprot:TRINITY_DN1759_c0_g1_i5.p2 TRINITY_DN1759_c0_g1~~TRINITY_DN1759_c0_g1_i5.p2  ORF type:complete len:117 (-),score=15.78 TRINITY_DN1759_c0_g1_i5:738-1088(-)